MRTRIARSCARWISSACVLTALASCADTKIVYRDGPAVEIKIPVYVALPAELLEVVQPRFLYPRDSLPIAAMEDKITALELALGTCNNNLEVIRSKQPKPAQ